MWWKTISTFCLLIHMDIVVNESDEPPNPRTPPPPSKSRLGIFYNAAVTSFCEPCPSVGRDVMRDGGNAVDAALAVMFCEGVTCLHNMGLGGGFFMTIYNRSTGQVYAVNAREAAPSKAHTHMFSGQDAYSKYGGLAVATSGQLRGYWQVYQKFGSIPWARLIEPSIQLCQQGFVVTSMLAQFLKFMEQFVLKSESLRDLLVNPSTGSVLVEGDVIVQPVLAKTLRIIADEGGETLNTGSLMANLVRDINDLGGIVTEDDMRNYRVIWEKPVRIQLKGNLTAYTVPAPSSGNVLALILNILDGFVPASDQVTTYHRVIEAYKWAFGHRSRMGDPSVINIKQLLSNMTSKSYAKKLRKKILDDKTYDEPKFYGARCEVPQDHGTDHISVLAPDGSAVAVTSTINGLFGAMVRSKSTGIILNNQMDDFSSPNITNLYGLRPCPGNFISPGKRPFSSTCPTIVVNSHGNVRLVVGGTGGSMITSSVPWVILRHLYLNETIKEAIDFPRVHHQLVPMMLAYEFGTEESIVSGLKEKGHKMQRVERGGTSASSITALAHHDGIVFANSDFRTDSAIAGFSQNTLAECPSLLQTLFYQAS